MKLRYLMAAALVAWSPIGLTDVENGKALHDQNCQACHIGMTGGDGSVLYTRSQRKVGSLSALEAQVRRCEANLELKWFDEDIRDVVAYLNQAYYKFPTE